MSVKAIRWLPWLGIWILVVPAALHAQVRSSLAVGRPVPDPAGATIEVRLAVTIQPGWHVYSLTSPEGAGVRSTITLAEGGPGRLVGSIRAPAPRRTFSPLLEREVETYEGEIEFTMLVRMDESIGPGTELAVDFTYQACNDNTCHMPKTVRLKEKVQPPAADRGHAAVISEVPR